MPVSSESPAPRQLPWGKLVLLLLLMIASAAAILLFRDEFTLTNLARHETRLRSLYEQHRLMAYALVFFTYMAVNGVSVPGAGVALTLFIGWFFGFWPAVLLVSFGSTAGAIMAFLLSRYLLRDLVAARFPARLKAMQDAFQLEGAWYLLTLRLLPIVPYFLINILMGLTTIRLRTYAWVSQVGMLPATFLYTYTASKVPSLEQLAEAGVSSIITPGLLLGLTLLAFFPLAMRKLLARRRA